MKSFFAMERRDYDQRWGECRWLHVNNFGYYRDITEEISISRPHGRGDYQLLYVASGEIGMEERNLEPGESYIFAPGEAQQYTYFPRKGCLYYWIHFTGNRVMDIFEESGLKTGYCAGNGKQNESEILLRLMANALSRRGESTPYVCSLCLSVLQQIAEPVSPRAPFRRAIKCLEDTGENCRISDLAQMYHMTTAHFIRSFKATYGTTPANYHIRCQVKQGKQLLTGTDLSVGSIAELCGFSDPLYFSRVFKQHTGITPTQYREEEAER